MDRRCPHHIHHPPQFASFSLRSSGLEQNDLAGGHHLSSSCRWSPWSSSPSLASRPTPPSRQSPSHHLLLGQVDNAIHDDGVDGGGDDDGDYDDDDDGGGVDGSKLPNSMILVFIFGFLCGSSIFLTSSEQRNIVQLCTTTTHGLCPIQRILGGFLF